MAYLLVLLGGGLGSLARYGVGRLTLSAFGPDYPYGTLAVNLIGGLAMGLLAGTLARVDQGGEQWRLFVGVGLLGGFTTFSAFSLDVALMMERGQLMSAAAYSLMSVIGSVAALFGGLAIARAAA
jgi:fluoride exporter